MGQFDSSFERKWGNKNNLSITVLRGKDRGMTRETMDKNNDEIIDYIFYWLLLFGSGKRSTAKGAQSKLS